MDNELKEKLELNRDVILKDLVFCKENNCGLVLSNMEKLKELLVIGSQEFNKLYKENTALKESIEVMDNECLDKSGEIYFLEKRLEKAGIKVEESKYSGEAKKLVEKIEELEGKLQVRERDI